MKNWRIDHIQAIEKGLLVMSVFWLIFGISMFLYGKVRIGVLSLAVSFLIAVYGEIKYG